MSKNLPDQQPSEEVDLGQLFKLIGNAFDRFFKFIGSILNAIFLAFVWLVFFIKKYIIILVGAVIFGLAIGFLIENFSDPIYKSYVTVKQNYDTGEDLYNSIDYYNELINQRDTTALAGVLGIKVEKAATILNFEVESVISENEKLKNFDKYTRELDSSFAATIQYKDYVNNEEDYQHELQQLTIKSKERDNFKTVFEKIVETINNNEFFKREQAKDLQELENTELALTQALVKSDSLQNTYKRVLEKHFEGKAGSATNITIEGADDKEKTKEFDLYKSDLLLRRELVDIARQKEDKQHIVEIISSKQDSGSLDYSKELFGLSMSPKSYYALILFSLTFTVLLGLQFIKFLERYKDKL